MTIGLPGHSRKLKLYDLLRRVGRDHPTWHLVIEIMLDYPVCERTVQGGLEALLWAKLITRRRTREGDRRGWVVSITEKGEEALRDPALVQALETLPMRNREAKAWKQDPRNPDPMLRRVEQWRREMRSLPG